MPCLKAATETILLVDDEELVRDLGKRILERSGYTVLTAANGKEALDLYNREMGKISLVILDLIMPEMGGKQCLEELLKIDPKARVLIAKRGRSEKLTLWCSKKLIHWMHRLSRENWDRRNGEFAVARNDRLLLCLRAVATTS